MMTCFQCFKVLASAMGHADDPPMEGVIFTSKGNYGSRVYDPMTDSEHLRIYICDDCLVTGANTVDKVKVKKTVSYETGPWDPSEWD